MKSNTDKPEPLGFGLGLRTEHYTDILEGDPKVDWFEIISENFMIDGGKPLYFLDRIAERYPLVMHGVSMSIASTAELNLDYFKKLKELARRVEPRWISDHLCWTGVHGVNLHDLLPFPYTQDALNHVCDRIDQVQEIIARPLTLENVSTYVTFQSSEMTEWEFIAEMTKRTGCWLLFDVNNVYVSSFNHGFDPIEFLNGIPKDRVIQFHLAGHDHNDTHIIDTHDNDVCEDVWDLYRHALKRFGPVSTMIERDSKIPPLSDMEEELDRARNIANEVFAASNSKNLSSSIAAE